MVVGRRLVAAAARIADHQSGSVAFAGQKTDADAVLRAGVPRNDERRVVLHPGAVALVHCKTATRLANLPDMPAHAHQLTLIALLVALRPDLDHVRLLAAD